MAALARELQARGHRATVHMADPGSKIRAGFVAGVNLQDEGCYMEWPPSGLRFQAVGANIGDVLPRRPGANAGRRGRWRSIAIRVFRRRSHPGDMEPRVL